MNPRGRILVVDDDLLNAEIMREVLSDEYDVKSVRSGEEALATVPEFQPDLVLLDIMMPGIDGYETCIRLRDSAEMRHGKIILVSAKVSLPERMKGYEAGADDYVTKPFDASELLAKVRVFLRLKRVEEVDDLKSNILDLLRHETRTPMTGIISSAELLMRDDNVPLERRPLFIRMIFENAKRLHTYLEKGALLCAFKAGTMVLRMEPVDLRKALEHAVAEKRDMAERHNVRVELTFGPHAWVQGNIKHLRAVCGELLDNAIRFSPEGGVVRVQIEGHGQHFEMRVTDHGNGIAPELVDRIFDGFAVADLRHHGVGHGMSLALCRTIVEYHEGEVRVRSRPEVETTFSVILPALQDAVARDDTPRAQPVTVSVSPRHQPRKP